MRPPGLLPMPYGLLGQIVRQRYREGTLQPLCPAEESAVSYLLAAQQLCAHTLGSSRNMAGFECDASDADTERPAKEERPACDGVLDAAVLEELLGSHGSVWRTTE